MSMPPDAAQRARPLSLAVFAVAALLPGILLSAGALWGGAWLWAGFLYMAILAVALDLLLPWVAGNGEGEEFPGSDLLLAALAIGSLVLMALSVWVIGGNGDHSGGQKLLLFFGTGFWLGQVGHPAAHELIHRGRKSLFRLGQIWYGAVLFGQHASAHRLVHHRHVATDKDPNSARAGEGFYHFAPRAWWGSFRAGLAAEGALRARAQGRRGLHPYALYLTVSALSLGLAGTLAGAGGVAVWIGLSLHAQSQILLSDYVQHYGLRRSIDASGRPEPVGPAHSWNAAPWFSAAMMLNAPRHSDHHSHPARPYPALRLDPPDAAPRLPWPLPLACAIALFPRRWRRAMKPRLAVWQKRAAPKQA